MRTRLSPIIVLLLATLVWAAGNQSKSQQLTITVSSGAGGQHSADLSWTASQTQGVSYNVYRSTTSGSYGAALVTGLTGLTYSDSTVQVGTTYYYKVSASKAGQESAKSNEAVAPLIAPVIAQQPASTSVIVGQSATFTVTATSGATLTYQWTKNNTPISGATSSTYTTPPTVIGDNGSQFAATVTNVFGQVTSAIATLTVSNQSAQVTPDNAGKVGTLHGAGTITVASVTVGTCTGRYMVVGVHHYPTNPATVIKYGTQSLTLRSSQAAPGTGVIEFYDLIAPASGTASLVATYTTTENILGVSTWCGASQTAPFTGLLKSSGQNVQPVVGPIISQSGSVVVDLLYLSLGTVATPTGSLRYSATDCANCSQGASQFFPGAASVQDKWNGTSGSWALIGFSINP